MSTSKVRICRDRNAIMVCVESSPIAEITWSKDMWKHAPMAERLRRTSTNRETRVQFPVEANFHWNVSRSNTLWQTSNCMPIPPCHVREGVFPSCSNQSRVSTSSNQSYETLEIQQIRCSFSVGGSPAILRVSTSKVRICRDRNAIMVCMGSSPIAWSNAWRLMSFDGHAVKAKQY